jgi:CRP/FNR family cyclic AMP-dependent transcriptional regulator
MAKNICDSLLFAGIDAKYVDEFLASLPEPVHLKKGKCLWRQGEKGHSMYLLKTGKLNVLVSSPGEEEKVIATIEAGAVIGEVCVFGQVARSATACAAEDSELLCIDGEKFRQQVQQKDVGVLLMSYNVAKILTQRLIMANDFIRNLHQMADKAVVKSELEHYRQRFFQESLFN